MEELRSGGQRVKEGAGGPGAEGERGQRAVVDPVRFGPLLSAPRPSRASQGRSLLDPPTTQEWDRRKFHRRRGDRRGSRVLLLCP